MEPITFILGALCCLGGMFVLMALVGFVVWRSQRSSKPSGPPAGGTPGAAESGSGMPASKGALPSAASEDLSGGASVGAGASVVRGGASVDDVEDFDEDGPTTLIDTRSAELKGLLGTPELPEVEFRWTCRPYGSRYDDGKPGDSWPDLELKSSIAERPNQSNF